jgi:hypothetical protein
LFLFASDVYAGSAPVAVMIEVMVAAPVIAKTALAIFARLAELMAIVIGLATIVPVAMNVALQLVFPFIDVPVATVKIIRPNIRRATQ